VITLAEARERARRRYDRHYPAWALAAALPPPTPDVHTPPTSTALLNLPLHPPSERTALADQAAAVEWVASWRAAGVRGVVWEQRRWVSLGTQELPVRLVLTDPAEVAALAGRAGHWRTVSRRLTALLQEWAEYAVDGEALPSALRTHASALTALPEEDFARLGAVLRWLVEHPDSGAYIRQLPIRGVDTKWTQRHRGLVTGLHRAVTGRPDLGLASPPDLLRVRFLDGALAPGGLSDISATVRELAALDMQPEAVLVVENLETLVALPALAGVVAVHGAGHAVDRLAGMEWVERARLLYWGDLDSHGFAILDRFRSYYPHVVSVLMDRTTLESHRDLWVPEPRPTRAALSRLTPEENEALARIRAEGDVRLEQERLDLTASVDDIREVLLRSQSGVRGR